MKLLAIFELLLSVTLASTFDVRRLRNDTLQQQLFMPAMQEKVAEYYSRITNGLPAFPNHFPYQVGLQTWYTGQRSMICGGSLISNEWVLTATHCLIDGITVSVYLGSILLENPRKVFHHVHKHSIIEHRGFNRDTFEHDIGLVKIPPTKFTEDINAVGLPPRNFPLHIGSYAYHAGWGVTSDASISPSPILRYYTFQIIKNEDCAKVFGSTKIYSGKVCTATSNQISACNGDSGSPLVLEIDMIQIGIASFAWSLGCELGYPIAYTRVEYYLDWIHKHTGLKV